MPHIEPRKPILTPTPREAIRFSIDHIGRTSATIEEAAARLTSTFPEYYVHGDQDEVGVYTKLVKFDGASGRLGKIGVRLGGVRPRR